MRRSAKIILVLVVAVALTVGAFLLFAFRAGDEQRGSHLAGVDWLPTEATDVTYLKREGFGWITCYECSLPKEALDRLARKEGWSLEPKSDVSTGLRLVLSPSPPKKAAESGGAITIDLSHEPSIPTVRKALFYEKRQPNGGGVTVIYDLEAGRLFVHESNR